MLKSGKNAVFSIFQRYPNFAAMKGWLPDVGLTQDFQPSSVMSSFTKIPSLTSSYVVGVSFCYPKYHAKNRLN